MSVLTHIFKPRSKLRVEMKRYFEFVGDDKSRKSEVAAKFREVSALGSAMNYHLLKNSN